MRYITRNQPDVLRAFTRITRPALSSLRAHSLSILVDAHCVRYITHFGGLQC
jgi:hypothetical protein